MSILLISRRVWISYPLEEPYQRSLFLVLQTTQKTRVHEFLATKKGLGTIGLVANATGERFTDEDKTITHRGILPLCNYLYVFVV